MFEKKPLKLIDRKLNEFSDELASASPAPGGGSVAALCGNLSTALTSMVANLTIGKDKYTAYETEMKEILTESEELRAKLLSLIDEDTAAFNAVMEAFKLPKGSDERKQALQEAFKTAADVPMRTARFSYRALQLAEKAYEIGNQNSITDAAVAALVAHAGVQGALLNVKINLSSIKDEQYTASMKAKTVTLAADSDVLIEKIMNSINAKI